MPRLASRRLAVVLLVAAALLVGLPVAALAARAMGLESGVGGWLATHGVTLVTMVLGSAVAFVAATRVALYRLDRQEREAAKLSDLAALRSEVQGLQAVLSVQLRHLEQQLQGLTTTADRLAGDLRQEATTLARLEGHTGR